MESDILNLSEVSNPSKLKKPHLCPFEGCTASFQRPHKLEAHIKKHNGERPFRCDFPQCSKTYTNSSHLKRHKVTAHENSQESREYFCIKAGCGLVVSNKYALQKHIKRYHHEDTFPFKCNLCPEKFKKRKHLSEHFNLIHGHVPYWCESCQIGFLSLIQYTKHQTNHKTFTCDCDETFDRWTKFCKHRRTDCPLKQIEHTCVICKKTFTTKRNLRAHSLKVHIEESQIETYRCPYLNCHRSYQYKRNLNYHIASFHEKSLPDMQIKCTHSECDVVFKTERNLYRHLKSMHGRTIKIHKPKKPRKDKGKRKFCMAAVLSGVTLTSGQHLNIIKNSNAPRKDIINLTDLKISVPKTENCEIRNHISEALKIGSMKGIIKVPRVENHLQGKMLVVVLSQEPIHKLIENNDNCGENVTEMTVMVSGSAQESFENNSFADEGSEETLASVKHLPMVVTEDTPEEIKVEKSDGSGKNTHSDAGSESQAVEDLEVDEASKYFENYLGTDDDDITDSVILKKCDEILQHFQSWSLFVNQ